MAEQAVRAKGKAVQTFSATLWPRIECDNCGAKTGGRDWLTKVREHLRARPTHVVHVIRQTVATYEWQAPNDAA